MQNCMFFLNNENNHHLNIHIALDSAILYIDYLYFYIPYVFQNLFFRIEKKIFFALKIHYMKY